MILDVRLDAANGLVVLSWRTAEDGLFLTARGRNDEVRLQCICGRCGSNQPGAQSHRASSGRFWRSR